MKKTYKIFRKLIFLFILVCLFLFNTSCGLDVFYVINEPTVVVHMPIYSQADKTDNYFSFYTNESTDIEGFVFQGTDVYYKIYNNSDTLLTEVNTLTTLASDTDKSSTACDRMTGTYAYKPLKIKNFNESVLVPSTGSNRLVYIRLTDYQSNYEYSSRVLIGGENGSNLYNSTSKTVPVRNTTDQRTFNFGRSGTYDIKPSSSDTDVKYSTNSDSDTWYVAMFAVAVGYDSTYANYYSNILYLGSVTIDSTEEDN